MIVAAAITVLHCSSKLQAAAANSQVSSCPVARNSSFSTSSQQRKGSSSFLTAPAAACSSFHANSNNW